MVNVNGFSSLGSWLVLVRSSQIPVISYDHDVITLGLPRKSFPLAGISESILPDCHEFIGYLLKKIQNHFKIFRCLASCRYKSGKKVNIVTI